MFQNNYTENSFLFKGLILKNLKIDEITVFVKHWVLGSMSKMILKRIYI